MTGASDSVALVISELVTNAVIASRALGAGPSPVRFWLLSDRREILILVSDASPHPPGRMSPTEDTESGRGLMLVEAVSKRWGWYRAAEAIEGKFVWALCET